MSDSVRPHRRHRRQPTRFPRPWDSPGKNTGVGCHFLLQSMKVKSESEVVQSCPTLCDPMDCMQPTRLLHPWDFPGKSTGVGCHCLLQYSEFQYRLSFYVLKEEKVKKRENTCFNYSYFCIVGLCIFFISISILNIYIKHFHK